MSLLIALRSIAHLLADFLSLARKLLHFGEKNSSLPLLGVSTERIEDFGDCFFLICFNLKVNVAMAVLCLTERNLIMIFCFLKSILVGLDHLLNELKG